MGKMKLDSQNSHRKDFFELIFYIAVAAFLVYFVPATFNRFFFSWIPGVSLENKKGLFVAGIFLYHE